MASLLGINLDKYLLIEDGSLEMSVEEYESLHLELLFLLSYVIIN